MGEQIGPAPEPPPEMAFVNRPPELLPLSAPKVIERDAEPEVIPGFIAGALKRVYVPVTNDAGETIGQRLVQVDDAGTEHPF